MTRLVVDPVTRVGGQLRIEADVVDGAVAQAWSSGTSYRGLERIISGRDPRDAWLFAERICGSCSGIHALASVRAVEAAIGITIPTNARLVRNIMTAARFVSDHVAALYVRTLVDWVDLPAALRADPAAAAELTVRTPRMRTSTTTELRTAQQRLASLLGDAGSGGVTAGGAGTGMAGHPAYRLSPEADLLLAAHRVASLDWQRTFDHLQVLLGGKDPHPQTFLVGGMALAAPWGGPAPELPREHPIQVDRHAPWALSQDGVDMLSGLVAEARRFVEEVYVPDMLLLADAYRDWAAVGQGKGDLLSFGEFPLADGVEADRFLPPGRISAGALGHVDRVDQASVAEDLSHAWYEADGDGAPTDPPPEPRYSGPALPYATLEGSERYSWIKAPRYLAVPMETGPLARVLVAHVEGREEVAGQVDRILQQTGLVPDELFGTLGRMIARAVEAQVLVERLQAWLVELRANLATGDLAAASLSKWEPAWWPSDPDGVSLGEGPRGAVGHWVSIRAGKVDRYQVVDGSTWNASPRDRSGRPGPLETALVGTRVADATRPLEIMRVVGAFDPCAGCAVHYLDPHAPPTVAVRAEGARS
jgi:hydrogenase large subunit